MRYSWLFVAVCLTIFIAANINGQTDGYDPPPLEMHENLIAEIGGICSGDILFIPCYIPTVDGTQISSQSFKISVIITDETGNRTTISDSDPDGKYDDRDFVFKLPSMKSQIGKTYSYKCLYGKLPFVDDRLHLENCNTNSNFTDVNNCYFDNIPERRFAHWNCSKDDLLARMVNEGETAQLYCNGMTENRETLWFFENQLYPNLDRQAGQDLLITYSRLSDTGMYTCLSYNKTEGRASKHCIELEVIPKVRAPTDLYAVQQGDKLNITWKSYVKYIDRTGWPRPSSVTTSHKVSYIVIHEPGSSSYNNREILQSESSGVTLNVTKAARLYLVEVESPGRRDESGPKISKLFFVNNASDTGDEVRKLGDMLDINCGTDKFNILYETKPRVTRLCVDNLGKTIRTPMTMADLQRPFLPEDACVYECVGRVLVQFKHYETLYTEQVDFRFSHILRTEVVDLNLPSITNLYCSFPGSGGFGVSWSIDRSVGNTEAMKAVFVLIGSSDRRLFNTSLNTGYYRFGNLEKGSSYFVRMAVEDDSGQQGPAVLHRCSTGTSYY